MGDTALPPRTGRDPAAPHLGRRAPRSHLEGKGTLMPFNRFAMLLGAVLAAGAVSAALLALAGPQALALVGVLAVVAALLVRRRG